MSTLTIRKLDPSVKQELRRHAAERGVSMEQEARDRLAASFGLGKRRKPILEELERLAVTPSEPVDQKKLADELWQDGLEWPLSS